MDGDLADPGNLRPPRSPGRRKPLILSGGTALSGWVFQAFVSMRPGEASFDRWSLAHAGAGMGLALVLASPLLVFGLLLVYELLEAGLRRVNRDPAGRGVFEYESWPNIAADVMVGMAGFVAARLLLQLV